MSKYSSSHIFPRKPPALSGEATDISYKGRQCMIILYFTGRQHWVPISRLRQGWEGMWRKGRSSQETIEKPRGKVLVPPQGMNITILLSSFADTETRTRWEKLTASCWQARRCQTGWNQTTDDADSHFPHHQPVRRMPTRWSGPLWTTSTKYPLWVATQFWGH